MTEYEETDNWRMKTLLIGTILGALTGLGAAYLLVQQAEKAHSRPEISPGQGVKLGLMLLGTIRSVAELGKDK